MSRSGMHQTPAVPAASGWRPTAAPPAFHPDAVHEVVERVREPVHLVWHPQGGWVGAALGGEVGPAAGGDAYPLLGTLPPLFPEWLGDRAFGAVHGTRFPYVVGEMANGIATADLVVAAAEAGCLGFFGAAGLALERARAGVEEIGRRLGPRGLPWGVNLIHSPSEPALEERLVDLFLEAGATRVSASAFMALTPGVVRFAASGLTRGADGAVVRRNHLFAKVSRPEVARHFLAPPPERMLRELVAAGHLSGAEAALAALLPVAGDVTVEADSGGHTDNRPLTALLPGVMRLRDELAALHGFAEPPRVGAAGGLGTPSGVAAAFALGAAYVLTGSVNQGCVEAGLSPGAKRLLAAAEATDVIMAPAADMFELGVKVQVLRRGTLFGPRAQALYEAFRAHDSLEALPEPLRTRLEREVFRAPLAEIWEETRRFWTARDPRPLQRAEADPKLRMALVFRWYLGNASAWAIRGTPGREADYQIWCGPAMGAFNAWTAGSFLAEPERRTAGQVALNLMEGTAVVTRAQQLRSYGVPVPPRSFDPRPRPLA